MFPKGKKISEPKVAKVKTAIKQPKMAKAMPHTGINHMANIANIRSMKGY